MAGKRSATTDLNHENWDKEEKHEDKGVFKAASSEEIQNRVIKKARRKLPSENSGNEETKSVFRGFTGFSKTVSNVTTVSGTPSPFSFLSKLTPSSTPSTTADNQEIEKGESETPSPNNFQFEKSNTYYAKLKGLNLAVSNWIKKHVDENPLCILTPIFHDYDKYLKEIEQDKEKENYKIATAEFTFASSANSNGKDKNSESESQKKTDSSITSEIKPVSFSFKKEAEATSTKLTATSGSLFSLSKSNSSTVSATAGQATKPKIDSSAVTSTSTATFSFGQKAAEKPMTTVASTSLFSFKPSTTAATSTTGFSFSGAKPFSFGASLSKPEGQSEPLKEEDEEEDDQPPKVEFKPVVEEDSVYSKKCKLFVKQGNSYTDRGVGTLYLKPINDKDKTQLLVRADTNLGNILVNLILNESIPVQRMGKNNVMMVCIPTPESEQKPTPILLRVKTGEEADELLETINNYKK